MNILIIEDDARIADFLGRGLRAEGHRVELVSTGPDGLTAARQRARDAVADGQATVLILDLMLPGMGGLEICQTLRAEGVGLPIHTRSATAPRADSMRIGKPTPSARSVWHISSPPIPGSIRSRISTVA